MEIYQACQIAFIKWMIVHQNASYLNPLYKHLVTFYIEKPSQSVGTKNLATQLNINTIYTELETTGLSDVIIPHQKKLYDALKMSDDISNLIKLLDIHKTLMSFVLRTTHGIIDIYLTRLMQGPGNLTLQKRNQWLKDFVQLLEKQKESKKFSTCYELIQLAAHLELIIKNNIPKKLEPNRDEYPMFLRQSLNPVSPVIGASGETSGRSAQATKIQDAWLSN